MNNSTSTQQSKSLPGDTNSSYIYLLVYIAILATLKAIILLYWFFVECQTGKLIAQKIVDNEFCNNNNNNNNNTSSDSDIYEITDKDKVNFDVVRNHMNNTNNGTANTTAY